MKLARTLTILSRRFSAKRIFITGAGSGLGRAMALGFAGAGWNVGVADLSAGPLASAATEFEAAGAAAMTTFAGDVASEPFVAGAVDVTPVADWRWIVDINLLGVVC